MGILASIYLLRVWVHGGFYVVSYMLAIYELQLALLFLQPKVLPKLTPPGSEGPALPEKAGDEFRPFIRRLPEFKLWLNSMRAFGLALLATLVPWFDIPCYAPMLVLYFFLLLFALGRKQLEMMRKYNFVPFDTGRKLSK